MDNNQGNSTSSHTFIKAGAPATPALKIPQTQSQVPTQPLVALNYKSSKMSFLKSPSTIIVICGTIAAVYYLYSQYISKFQTIQQNSDELNDDNPYFIPSYDHDTYYPHNDDHNYAMSRGHHHQQPSHPHPHPHPHHQQQPSHPQYPSHPPHPQPHQPPSQPPSHPSSHPSSHPHPQPQHHQEEHQSKQHTMPTIDPPPQFIPQLQPQQSTSNKTKTFQPTNIPSTIQEE